MIESVPVLNVDLRLEKVLTSTNKCVKLSWSFSEQLPASYKDAKIQIMCSEPLGSLGPEESPRYSKVDSVPVSETNFLHRANFTEELAVLYQLVLSHRGKYVDYSSPVLYQHPGTWVPLPAEIEKIEKTMVDGRLAFLVYPTRSPYLEKSTYSVAVKYGREIPTIRTDLAHLDSIPLVLSEVAQTGADFQIKVVEEAVVEVPGTEAKQWYIPGEYSRLHSLTEPRQPISVSIHASKQDRVLKMEALSFHEGVTSVVAVVDGKFSVNFIEPSEKHAELDSFGTSEFYSVTNYENGISVTGRLTSVRATRSNQPMLERIESLEGGSHILNFVCQMVYLDGSLGKPRDDFPRAWLFVNGKRIAQWADPPGDGVVRSPEVDLKPGDQVQLALSDSRGRLRLTPVYRIVEKREQKEFHVETEIKENR